MARTVDTKEYLDMICELLAQGRTDVPIPVAGHSMTPFLHNGDTVSLNKVDTPLKKGDIVLYTRRSGQYVLHRIVKIASDGSFLMTGDGQTELERIESAAQIHGRVSAAIHRGKRVGTRSPRWIFFATVWIWVRPLRPGLMTLAAKLKRKTR